MTGLIDRILGRTKKAVADVTDDPGLRREGAIDERKADAKEELAQAEAEADRRAHEIAALERKTAS